MGLGFIGTGGITTAIVTGLCTGNNPPESIWVSPRNKETAARLASDFDQVRVAQSNQEVLDNCDVIFLAILPQDKEKILPSLTFREEQLIIHLLAGTTIHQVVPLVKPAWRIVRAVPLPCTAIHVGPIAICPDHDVVTAVFDPLGTVIALEEESQLETLSVITGVMAPYYALIKEIAVWGAEQGIASDKAVTYTASMFGALSQIAQNLGDGNIDDLVTDCMTPGGLNELAMKVMDADGGFNNVRSALDAVKNKL